MNGGRLPRRLDPENGSGRSTPSPFHEHPLYLFISEGSLVDPSADSVKAMYRLACRSCGEAFEEGETPVPSRSIRGNPLVHAECSE